MTPDREAISKFVYQLRNQNIVSAWTLASEEAIYSAAAGKQAAWGPKASRLRTLLQWADKLLLADFILLLVGAGAATKLWWKVRKDSRGSSGERDTKRVFVGFGANSEEELWKNYRDKTDVASLRINQSSCKGMAALGCPGLIPTYFVLLRELAGYSARLKTITHVAGPSRSDFLTACGMNAGIYAFHRKYWEMARKAGVVEATFLASDIPAFACVDAGIPTTYLQHGLISLTILLPKFSTIETLTADEENYLRRLNCEADITRVARDEPANGPKNNVLLLLSVDDTPERLVVAKRLIDWANRIGVSVVVRPLPRFHNDPVVQKLQGHLPGVHFDTDLLSIEDSLARYNPKFIVAWTSTALPIGLSYGCLPVSLLDPDSFQIIQNMVYPMLHRVLFWPRDEHIMNMVFHSEQAFTDNVKRLHGNRDSAFDWIGRQDGQNKNA